MKLSRRLVTKTWLIKTNNVLIIEAASRDGAAIVIWSCQPVRHNGVGDRLGIVIMVVCAAEAYGCGASREDRRSSEVDHLVLFY